MHSSINKYIFLVLTVFPGFLFSCSGNEKGNQNPNIIILLADDQGYGDMGITGNTVMETPNIDTFAKESAVMNKFYVCPVCAPTPCESDDREVQLSHRSY